MDIPTISFLGFALALAIVYEVSIRWSEAEVLEIGSRVVNGITHKKKIRNYKRYIGFDALKGLNVDVTGDVLDLSSYFLEESFEWCIQYLFSNTY